MNGCVFCVLIKLFFYCDSVELKTSPWGVLSWMSGAHEHNICGGALNKKWKFLLIISSVNVIVVGSIRAGQYLDSEVLY